MKKLMMAIAVIVNAASGVRAEELKMDFDKGSYSSQKFMEAVKAQELSASGLSWKAPSVESGNAGDPSDDSAILATINRCENKKVDETLRDDLKKLLVYGTAEEKAQFNTPEKYVFPKRLNAFLSSRSLDQLAAAEDKSLGNCVKWASKDVCRDKEIWQTACLAGTVWCFTAAGGSCGPAGAVCTLVNKIVSECVPVPYCVEWDSEAIPGFGNPGVV